MVVPIIQIPPETTGEDRGLPPFHPRSTRRRTTRTLVGAAALAATSMTLAACGGGGSSSPSSGPTSTPDAGGAQPVASTVVLGSVAGNVQPPNRKVFKKHRKQVLDEVGSAVDTWIDGGFVGVSYPRDDFGSAFQAFTKPAAADAQHQQRLMTNWALRNKIDGVAVKKRSVTVDVLAPRGRPAGATARVALAFTTTGDVDQRVVVHARLFLAPDTQGTWQIFGFDVAKGGR
jgi:hypothetical protein